MDTFNELSIPGYPNVNHGKHSSLSNLRFLLMSFQNFIAAHTPTAVVLSASANIRFDPVVSSLVNSISLNQMRDDSDGSRVKMESPESSLVTRLQRVLV